MIRAGRLDRFVIIQVSSLMADSVGQLIETWATYASTWAELVSATGSESFLAEQRSARQSVRFRIRYRPGVTAKMRVLHKGEVYEIEDVSENDQNTEIVLTCYAYETATGG